MSLFPPKSASQQKPKKGAAFRPRDDQGDYLDRMKKRGYSKTQVLITALDVLIDAEKELGQELKLMATLAEIHGLTLGTILARAAKIGFPQVHEQLSKQKIP